MLKTPLRILLDDGFRAGHEPLPERPVTVKESPVFAMIVLAIIVFTFTYVYLVS